MKYNMLFVMCLCVGVVCVNVKADDDDETDWEDFVEVITATAAACKSIYKLSLIVGWPCAIILSVISCAIGGMIFHNCSCCREVMTDKKYQRHRIAAETGYLIWG